MLTVSGVSLAFTGKKLFEDVNVQFLSGNVYGVIGANGAGKSTFLHILAGEQDTDRGTVSKPKDKRIAVLPQDQNMFDEHKVLDTVLMGYNELYKIGQERDTIYAKEDFSEEDGIRAADLEERFASLGGWEAESEVGVLISGLGLADDILESPMSTLEPMEKVRVLLAQALFGNPDILLMDEPTNGLDLESIQWLEDFLSKFDNVAIIVSHNRHFLNAVSTHTLDIDYKQVNLYVGNYDFWYEASQLMQRQKKLEEKKSDKMKAELQAFIQRFSAHKARAKQATSRKKLLEKLDVEQLPQSSRKFPYVHFSPERECGRSVLEVKNLTITYESQTAHQDYSFLVERDQKIAFVGGRNVAKIALFEALANRITPDAGTIEWGTTISVQYYPQDNSEYFITDTNIFEWLKSYTDSTDDQFIRGFLGRMLFSGDEVFKSVKVLSGGEKARCLLSKIMLAAPNVIIMDEPTNHLDLEAITALNNALINFKGVLLFNSHDQQFIDTIATRIIEFTPTGVIDRQMSFFEYLEDPQVKTLRDQHYSGHDRMML